MPTPICHRTLMPDPHPRYVVWRDILSDAEITKLRESSDILRITDPSRPPIERLHAGSPCLGSACALWTGERGKNGYCADNPDRIRDDPARGT